MYDALNSTVPFFNFQIQELMELAVSSPLNPQQRAALLQAIKDDASELSQLGINADNVGLARFLAF